MALRKGNYLNIESAEKHVFSFVRIHGNEGVIVVSYLGTQVVNSSLSLPASSLSPGVYFVTDLYNNQKMGTITINGNGGFDNWQSGSSEIVSRLTRVLLLSTDNPVKANNVCKREVRFQVFPNPTFNEVNIQWEGESFQNGNVTVFSANGLSVYQGIMNSESLIIPTSDWSQGVYFVHISVNGRIGIRRVVIL